MPRKSKAQKEAEALAEKEEAEALAAQEEANKAAEKAAKERAEAEAARAAANEAAAGEGGLEPDPIEVSPAVHDLVAKQEARRRTRR